MNNLNVDYHLKLFNHILNSFNMEDCNYLWSSKIFFLIWSTISESNSLNTN